MNFHFLKILVLNELRLRTRRVSSIVALLAVSFLSWSLIGDPNNGHTMLAVNDTRVLYNSATMALGSVSLASPLFCLIGFFLVRGRIAEDLRSGIGSVIGASSVSNISFLLARWLAHDPQHAAILLIGIVAFAALATLLGRTTGTPRTFMSLYLFWWYVATQTPKIALVDVLGFNGAANLTSMSWHAAIGSVALIIGVLYNRWRSAV